MIKQKSFRGPFSDLVSFMVIFGFVGSISSGFAGPVGRPLPDQHRTDQPETISRTEKEEMKRKLQQEALQEMKTFYGRTDTRIHESAPLTWMKHKDTYRAHFSKQEIEEMIDNVWYQYIWNEAKGVPKSMFMMSAGIANHFNDPFTETGLMDLYYMWEGEKTIDQKLKEASPQEVYSGKALTDGEQAALFGEMAMTYILPTYSAIKQVKRHGVDGFVYFAKEFVVDEVDGRIKSMYGDMTERMIFGKEQDIIPTPGENIETRPRQGGRSNHEDVTEVDGPDTEYQETSPKTQKGKTRGDSISNNN